MVVGVHNQMWRGVQPDCVQPDVGLHRRVECEWLLQVSLVMSAKHSGRSVVPQQRMLRMTSVANRAAAAYFNLKPSKLQDNAYTLTLTPTNIQKQAGSQVTAALLTMCYIADSCCKWQLVQAIQTKHFQHANVLPCMAGNPAISDLYLQ